MPVNLIFKGFYRFYSGFIAVYGAATHFFFKLTLSRRMFFLDLLFL